MVYKKEKHKEIYKTNTCDEKKVHIKQVDMIKDMISV